MQQKLKSIINLLTNKQNLDYEAAKYLYEQITNDTIASQTIADILHKLHIKKETTTEIKVALEYLHNQKIELLLPFEAIDVCGTGGDNKNLLNISTAVAFVLAGLGIKVAKHGNKAISSKSGSADVLSELSININLSSEKLIECLEKANIAFLFAPNFHPILKKVAKARKLLKHKTIFNILGPLLNPANVNKQLIGVFNYEYAQKIATIIQDTNMLEHAIIIHSEDGFDEASILSPTNVFEIKDKKINKYTITPLDYKLENSYQLSDIQGKDIAYNAKEFYSLLEGKKSPYRDMVILNSSLSLKLKYPQITNTEAKSLSEKSINNHQALKSLHILQNIASKNN